MKCIYLVFPEGKTRLVGYNYGKNIYNMQLKGEISPDEITYIVFPEQIEKVSSSFLEGLFEDIFNQFGYKVAGDKVRVETKNESLKNSMLMNGIPARKVEENTNWYYDEIIAFSNACISKMSYLSTYFSDFDVMKKKIKRCKTAEELRKLINRHYVFCNLWKIRHEGKNTITLMNDAKEILIISKKEIIVSPQNTSCHETKAVHSELKEISTENLIMELTQRGYKVSKNLEANTVASQIQNSPADYAERNRQNDKKWIIKAEEKWMFVFYVFDESTEVLFGHILKQDNGTYKAFPFCNKRIGFFDNMKDAINYIKSVKE